MKEEVTLIVKDIMESAWLLPNRAILKDDIQKDVCAELFSRSLEKRNDKEFSYTVLMAICKKLQRRCFDVWDSKMYKDMAKYYNEE